MPLTTLDPNSALIVIDLQKGIVALPTVHPVDAVVSHAAALARTFRSRGLPVVLVNVDASAPGRTDQGESGHQWPSDWTEFVSELDRQEQDHIVTKRTWGAFTATDLDGFLKSRSVTQVVIVGVATSAGVESTARQAHELGYNVVLAIDAMTDLSKELHENSITRIFPRIGETGSTQEIIDQLDLA